MQEKKNLTHEKWMYDIDIYFYFYLHMCMITIETGDICMKPSPPLHNVLQSINIDSMEVGWFVGWLARLPGTWVHDEGRIWEEINQLLDGLHNRSHTYCSLVHNWVPKVLHQCTVSDFAEGLGLWSMSRCGHRWRIYAGNAYQIKWPV